MGVTGLWKLIEPVGKPVPVETLEGKVLAVDISIWLHQVVKGFQDSKGSALNNAHLLGLFHRLCKLLYYRVRPVFIFDGCVPQLKRDTIARRNQQRSKLSNEADRLQALLLHSLAKEKVVQQALGTNAELLLKSPGKRPTGVKSNKDDDDNIFKLPELPPNADVKKNTVDNEFDESYADTSATSDSSFDESTARHTYNASLQGIDVKSQHFKSLPADVRHEILTDIKETRKQSSWGRLHELPARSDDFCSFQMKRLLKRRAVQESLEQAEQEMGGHTLTYAELSEFFNEEGIVTPTAIQKGTRQISSDENTRFLLVRDLKKKSMLEGSLVKQPKCDIIMEDDAVAVDANQPCTSAMLKLEEKLKNVDNKYDADLAMALALSMEDANKVYNAEDYDYDSDQDLRLNREQTKQLRNAVKGPARTYMIEYGGMNDEEVENIMESTQLNDTHNLGHLLQKSIISDKVYEDSQKPSNSIQKITPTTLIIKDEKKACVDLVQLEQVELINIDSGTDSDLEEVTDNLTELSNIKGLEICVNVKCNLDAQEDIFADIFQNNGRKKDKSKNFEKTNTDKTKTVPDEYNIFTDDKVSYNQQFEKITVPKEFPKMEGKKQNTFIKMDPSGDKFSSPLMNHKLILSDLNQQTKKVKNIKLESIKLPNLPSSTIIDLASDNEVQKIETDSTSKNIIELCDSEEEISRTPANKTPSKNKSITDFFVTTYNIKRTPDKEIEINASPPTTPKIAQPFYVKRTPKSGYTDDILAIEDVPPSGKAIKSLFNENNQNNLRILNPEELIKVASDSLKAQTSEEELKAIALNLVQERSEIEIERNRQDRMGMPISQRMSIECQNLLRLFGIPYVIAPMEAEAQCAFLNAVELTDGTITDDSDIWLFGGRTVYKNFFAQNKHVLEFRADQIEKKFNCNRNKLIQLACLVGSDYTTGIHGIGAVTALEILASFSSSTNDTKLASTPDNAHSKQSVLSTLVEFRDWWQAHKLASMVPGSSARHSLRKKLKNIELHDGFPSASVVEAYLSPKVDDSRDAFSWGSPDIESLREFARKSFGWTTSKTDDILMPVMKKINEKKIQGSIRNYFTATSAIRVQHIKVSKRVQLAIDKMSGKIDKMTPEKPSTRRVRRNTTTSEPVLESSGEATTTKISHSVAIRRTQRKRKSSETTTSLAVGSTLTLKAKYVRKSSIKETRNPQRQQDMEKMEMNKAKAAEIFRKNAGDI
ncbi:DNA repair protein complementing XP-G cells homolog [Drosophila busckii]|uniref:DNA repair protein complementing XP-G cells homolog n=1 Tax=Drosophila busckii TaxID=30019 RepID=UPI00083EDE6E|nr:DNA repair protein complementing XP-G cells homolog [Drosophila busckii]